MSSSGGANGNKAAAAKVARKGVGMLWSATRNGVTVLSRSVSKARKNYASKHESEVLEELRNGGVPPAELVFQALTRIYFLYMAGYKYELQAAAIEAGKRLLNADKSSVPPSAVLVFTTAVSEEAQNYHRGAPLAAAKLTASGNKEEQHPDRTALSHDVYYALLATVKAENGTELNELERVFRDATRRVIGNAMHASEQTKDARAKAAKAMLIFANGMKLPNTSKSVN